MSGIYGNILDHFPELFRLVTFWEMVRLSGGGFGPKTNERVISVITLNKSGDAIKRKKLVSEWVLDDEGNDVVYSYDSANIALGSYMMHPDTGELNVVMKRLGYSLAGGMKVWGIQKVQGDDYLDPKTLAPAPIPAGGVF